MPEPKVEMFAPVVIDGNGFGGCTMLDWFAGQALAGMLAYPGDLSAGSYHNNSSPDDAAEVAYHFAEAMMKRRAALAESQP